MARRGRRAAPLYAVALLAGATTMRMPWFAAVVLLGRVSGSCSSRWPAVSRPLVTAALPRRDYSGAVPKIFSNLNLNGATPPRVQPRSASGARRRCPARAEEADADRVGLVLLAAMIAIFLLGWYVYHAMTGSWGFGIGENQQFFG